MQNANANAISFSKSLGNLKVDFYESGIGDTILITFPSGGVGIVDAHPSKHSHRPDIRQLVAGKQVLFVCLTHPHADHGADLIPVMESHPDVAEFWFTIHDVQALMYGITQTPNFPSPVQQFAAKMNQDWGDFLLDLFEAVAKRKKVHRHLLKSNNEMRVVDEVEVHCLGPNESVLNEFFDAYRKKLANPNAGVPNPNLLSAILALKYGEGVVVLGADALRKNWDTALEVSRKRGLPKAHILKVPHHGARNAFDFKHKAATYLDLCSRQPECKSVLFAGDAKHPDAEVYENLRRRSDVYCLSNGRKRNLGNHNPLGLQLPGARAVVPAPICNPVVSFEIDKNGNVTVLAGHNCDGCPVN